MNETREAVRTRQAALFGTGPHTLLPCLCLELRAGVNGSVDPWQARDVVATLALLRERLAVWQPSRPREQRLDTAVRELVEATIAEVEAYDGWKETKP